LPNWEQCTRAKPWVRIPQSRKRQSSRRTKAGSAGRSSSLVNAGHWNPRFGQALVLDDGSNVLRTYDYGDSGFGTVITTDVPVSDGTSGLGPGDTIRRACDRW
jgi:hypothetical protein